MNKKIDKKSSIYPKTEKITNIYIPSLEEVKEEKKEADDNQK